MRVIVYSVFDMLLLDTITIADLRKFILEFLRQKKNRKHAERIYSAQSPKEKILLSFVKANLERNIAVFTVYHRIYLAVLFTLIPQYAIIIASNAFMGLKSLYVLMFFAAVKLIINFVVWINTDSNRVSRYRER